MRLYIVYELYGSDPWIPHIHTKIYSNNHPKNTKSNIHKLTEMNLDIKGKKSKLYIVHVFVLSIKLEWKFGTNDYDENPMVSHNVFQSLDDAIEYKRTKQEVFVRQWVQDRMPLDKAQIKQWPDYRWEDLEYNTDMTFCKLKSLDQTRGYFPYLIITHDDVQSDRYRVEFPKSGVNYEAIYQRLTLFDHRIEIEEVSIELK